MSGFDQFQIRAKYRPQKPAKYGPRNLLRVGLKIWFGIPPRMEISALRIFSKKESCFYHTYKQLFFLFSGVLGNSKIVPNMDLKNVPNMDLEIC